jgi:hypothetical protein
MESARASGFALGAVLVAFSAAHLTLAAGLARRGPWWRAALALAVPPLAPWWGWGVGLRWQTIAWGATLLLYAFGVATA